MNLLSFCVLTLLLQLSGAFLPSSFGVHRPHRALYAGEDKDGGGGAAIAKPAIKTDQKTKTTNKQGVKSTNKARTHDPISRRDDDFEDAPLFKLMLLADESYDAGHVIDRMCAIVEDMDEGQAAEVYQQAEQEGKAMCGKYPYERAELFKEQLIRSDPMIYSDLEEENK